MAKPKKHVFICVHSRPPGQPRGSCSKRGSMDLIMAFAQQLDQRGMLGEVAVTRTGCLGACDVGPAVLVYPEGVMYGGVTPADVTEIINEHLSADRPVARLMVPEAIWG